MQNNDINYNENSSEVQNEQIIIPKVKIKSKKEYKNIFLCKLDKQDVVTSLDIFDDLIIYGTIMGNAYLCRMNKKQKIKKTKKENIFDINNNDNNINNINNDTDKQEKNKNDDSSKISCIKLENNKSNSNNISTNKNDRKNNIFYDSEIIPTTRSVYKKFINQNEINTKRKLINKNILENKNIKSEQSLLNQNSLISQSNNSQFSENIIPFPQKIQLITNASENIPCISFDTKEKVNIAMGDSDIIRFENLSSFFDNENNNHYFTQIKNYRTENDHIKYCEGALCFIYENNFLKLDTLLNDYYSPIIPGYYTYINKTITTYEVTTGEISMNNYIIPFDFDGDGFLYLFYESENIRQISIYYTLTKTEPFIQKINRDYGHISFMKFINKNKIIICRKNKICEIREISSYFKLIETWEHIGEEIITMNVYIKGSKDEEDDEDEKSEKSLTEITNTNKENKKEEINMEYIDTNYKKNKKSKSKNKFAFKEDIYGLNDKFNLKKFTGGDKVNNSTYRELMNINLKRQIKSNMENDNEIAIYNKNNISGGKENLTNEINNRKNIELLTNNNEYNYIQSNKEFVDKKNKIEFPKQKKIQKDEVYIITVDKNGNFNKYHDKEIKTIFNLYDIKNIEQNYKDEEFFSLGFPYFVVMNNRYYAISTDHGVFILSNKD